MSAHLWPWEPVVRTHPDRRYYVLRRDDGAIVDAITGEEYLLPGETWRGGPNTVLVFCSAPIVNKRLLPGASTGAHPSTKLGPVTAHMPWTYSASNPPRDSQPAPRPVDTSSTRVDKLTDAQLLAQAWRDLAAHQAKEARNPRRCAIADTELDCGSCHRPIVAGTRYSTVLVRDRKPTVHRDCVTSLL